MKDDEKNMLEIEDFGEFLFCKKCVVDFQQAYIEFCDDFLHY
jgi:hypothetical protein